MIKKYDILREILVFIQITDFTIYLQANRTTVFSYLYINLTTDFNSTISRTSTTYFANVVFFFFEYLPDDGRKRPKHVGGLLCDCIRGVIKKYGDVKKIISVRHIAVNLPQNTPPRFEHTYPIVLKQFWESSFVSVFSCTDVVAPMS